MISVIIPVYKVKEEYLRKCIESVINQTFKDLEIILIDDGSPDNCGAICDEYAKIDNRIKVIHKENGGVSSARNVGLDNAIGDYISFVDADDYVDNNYLETLISLYEDSSGSKDKIIQLACISFRVEERERINNSNKIHLLNNIQTEKYLHTNSIFGGWLWNKLFLSSVIKENNIRFDIGLHIREDSVFIQRYVNLIHYCKFVNKRLYFYRCPKDNCVCNIKYIDEIIPSINKQISYCFDKKTKERLEGLKYIYMIRLIKNGLIDECKKKEFIQVLNKNKLTILFDKFVKLKYKLYLLLKIH